MTREEALKAVKANVKNRNTVNHMLATEAIMRALARRFGEDEEEWGLAGLLHDIDLELTNADMKVHSKPAAEMAREMGGSEAMVHAILTHNEAHGVTRESKMDKALYCTDPITGLIVATTLVRPDKKLETVRVKSIRKKFKDKAFAAGASREQMRLCSELGLELEEFMELSLEAMQGIAADIGL